MKDPWEDLRRYTPARIAQGRAGHATTTAAHLDFQLAHAAARDAVHLPWDIEGFEQGCAALGLATLRLATPVADRVQYLKRPDLGRRLAPASRRHLAEMPKVAADIALIVSNGLSSAAVETHGLGLLEAIVRAYAHGPLPGPSPAGTAGNAPRLAPVCLVENARVALSDEIGALLDARLAVIIVGERPGLSAADSLGIYLTYRPGPGNTDAERNCISNVRPPEGLGYGEAAAKLHYLSSQAFLRQLSGVALKDDMPVSALVPTHGDGGDKAS